MDHAVCCPGRARPGGWRRRVAHAVAAAALMGLGAGCSASHYRQAFVAEDPATGDRAVYRIDLDASGGTVKYYFAGSYLPVSAIDFYQGKTPTALSDLDVQAALPSDAAAAKIKRQIDDLLASEAATAAQRLGMQMDAALALSHKPDTEAARVLDRQTVLLNRLFARSLASVSERQSAGDAGSNDPYRIRKLVYLISTKPIKIDEFSSEADEVENSLTTIAGTFGKIRAARQQSAAARQTAAQADIDALAALLKDKNTAGDMKPTDWTAVVNQVENLK